MGFCRSCKRQSHTAHIFTRIALRGVPSLRLLARLACDVYQAPKHTPKERERSTYPRRFSPPCAPMLAK